MGRGTVALETAAEIEAVASAFLAALSPSQCERATFAFGGEERQNWHYKSKPRQGLPRGDMDEAQLRAADVLMAAALSQSGFDTSKAIIRHELILGRIESKDGVRRFDRSDDLYFFSVFGTPGRDGAWGWRVEGHHLSVNVTLTNGDIVSVTPSFFGANPAEVMHGPEKGLPFLPAEEDLGRELFPSLGSGQRDSAVLCPMAPPDLITRASRRVEIAQAEGLTAARMSAEQREKLIGLVKVYTERMPVDVARAAMRKLNGEGVNSIRFGWAGSHHRDQGHYYRIHGAGLFIEYDNTQNMANHIHSVWRDVDGDFGFDVLGDHYARHHA